MEDDKPLEARPIDKQGLELLMKQDIGAWNEWRKAKLFVLDFVLGNVDLRGANLRGANLRDIWFYGTNFSDANFQDAILEQTFFTKVNFSRAFLSKQELEGISFAECNFSEAYLSGANLSRADLRDSNFVQADLSQTNLSSANLNKVNLSQANLIKANLTKGNLSWANLTDANLREVDLTSANLSHANFQKATLCKARLSQANLFEADLSGAELEDVELWHAELRSANFQRANLRSADLRGANLNIANFREANLSNAILLTTQALATDFSNAIFTGVCLEDWHTNTSTNLDRVVCDYIYRKFASYHNHSERRPHSRNFKPGEFTKLYRKALETVDIVFLDGIEWKAFLVSFLELKAQTGSDEISIQSFENRNGAFIVRINVPLDADKAEFEKLVEEKYQLVLKSKDEEISFLREEIVYKRKENTKIIGIIETMAEKDSSKKEYTFHAPVGSVENQGHIASSGNQNNIGNAAGEAKAEQKSIQHIHNYAPEQKQTLGEAAAEIQELLKQLQTQGYSPEAAQQKVASDLATKAKSNPTFKKKLVKWGQYLGDAAANGLIGEAVVTALKLTAQLVGIPIP